MPVANCAVPSDVKLTFSACLNQRECRVPPPSTYVPCVAGNINMDKRLHSHTMLCIYNSY